jgi:hypothetical protein
MKRIKLVIVLAVVMAALVFTPELAARVVKVTASVTPTSWSGRCPKRFEFVGKITVDKPGVVKYKWIRSDNANAPVKTLRFRKPGTQKVTTYWQLSAPGTHWEAVQILEPNQMKSNNAVFSLKCTPSNQQPVGCGIYFKSLSTASGFPGDTFKMYGTWGPTQGTKTPCINKGGPNKLIVLSWSNTVLHVKIPTGLAPGKYKVGVYCKFPITGPTGGSTWKDFTIKSRTLTAVRPTTVIKPGLIKPGVISTNCPDPAATEIRFQIVRRYSQFRGRIRITGVVKNIGGKAFIAGPNQAKAYLYQLPPGVPCANATGGTIVAQQAITNLAPGATLLVSWERDWNSSSPSEGEFPSCYRLLITYDPDIYMDASKDNDDCNQNNNKKDRSGTEINDMLR